jgi:hypothetical protein
LHDEGITMAELVELVHNLVKHENLPFFLGPDGRFHPWRIYRPTQTPSRRPASIKGGRVASREASRIRGISRDARGMHR